MKPDDFTGQDEERKGASDVGQVTPEPTIQKNNETGKSKEFQKLETSSNANDKILSIETSITTPTV